MLKEQVELLAAEVDTEANRTSGSFAKSHRGILATVKVSNLVAAPTYTPSLQMRTQGGDWVTFWTAAAAISANGTYTYLLYPDSAGATYTEKVDSVLPYCFRFVLTYSGTPTTDNADTEAYADLLP